MVCQELPEVEVDLNEVVSERCTTCSFHEGHPYPTGGVDPTNPYKRGRLKVKVPVSLSETASTEQTPVNPNMPKVSWLPRTSATWQVAAYSAEGIGPPLGGGFREGCAARR